MARHDWFRENSMTLWIARQIPDHFDPFPFENLLFLYLFVFDFSNIIVFCYRSRHNLWQ